MPAARLLEANPEFGGGLQLRVDREESPDRSNGFANRDPRKPRVNGRLCFLSLNALPYLCDAGPQFVGGAETQEVRIAEGLARRGWQVIFLTEDHGQGARVEGRSSIAVRATFSPSAGLPIVRFVWPRWRSVRQALRDAPADLYLTRTASIWSSVIARHARRRGAASLLALSHDREATGHLRGFLNVRDRWLYRRGLRQVDQIVTQTEAQAELLRDSTGLDSIVVSNGIEPDTGVRRPRAIRNERPRALWAGTLRPWKRPELILDLAASLPDVDFSLAGGADPRFPGLLNWLADRAKELPNLEVLGQVAPKRMAEIFDEADLLVCTSRSEGFANTFLEAWVRGIPVVSMGPDPRRAIAEGGAGLLAHDPRALREAVGALTSDSALAAEIGARARRQVIQHFSAAALVDRYERICRRLIGRALWRDLECAPGRARFAGRVHAVS